MLSHPTITLGSERPQLISDPDAALGMPLDRGGNQLYYTKSQEFHALWDTKLVVKVVTSTSFEQLAEILKEGPLTPPFGNYRAWPMKWVEDSEKVAIRADNGL